MAETIGSLIDKLCICKIREYKASQYGRPDILKGAMEQSKALKSELNELFDSIINGRVEVIEEKKLKMYRNEKDIGENNYSLATLINDLFAANLRLWDLEDTRRDKEVGDTDRLKACNDVSIWNQKRNKAVDDINELIAKSITRE